MFQPQPDTPREISSVTDKETDAELLHKPKVNRRKGTAKTSIADKNYDAPL